MATSLAMVTLDTTEPLRLATWWATQLNGSIIEENDGYFVVVSLGPGVPYLAFQKVDDPTPGKNRMHLDLASPEYPQIVDRLVSNGANKIEDRQLPGGFVWTTLADIDGNEFCISGGH
ncbi:VOC family protein [Mycolicibacterium sp. CH28]|uniref:VOC family protein n=1 Tax=Mycolicibacterium sp. CH28 TaxID=2512237 RepID=UPI0010801F50|nr:VOC family protein [Mycolicibacterium sp. CH28]TGD85816.1 VOC family protein [Mycolicibacterium sp. CH28]